ncbi:MarR family transcriptional regulator [Xylanibacillus composti]|uniref:HTH marR-type domain-containing protein n=1 Tax=Xylanibacillus composti TaxID=1572762 RepID=A0A8J4H2Z4_9BACL|nr:MarR family transcriptional regulator [Xylanibacillus composti]MDT9723404.1 MarR family transcriptional regulator [Xylanibacillus composti]GIQ68561.1 hypothetical protein XYCOK13_13850 [Xylanibacillus composti]
MPNSMERFLEKLQNRMAVDFEKDMFAPLAGRIMSQLIFATEPMSLTQLADNLSVSKAAVSVQVRILERMGLCYRLAKASDRKDYYAICEDFSSRIMNMVMEKTRNTVSRLEQLLSEFPDREEVEKEELAAYDIGKARLKEVLNMHSLFWERISDLDKVWEDMKHE